MGYELGGFVSNVILILGLNDSEVVRAHKRPRRKGTIRLMTLLGGPAVSEGVWTKKHHRRQIILDHLEIFISQNKLAARGGDVELLLLWLNGFGCGNSFFKYVWS